MCMLIEFLTKILVWWLRYEKYHGYYGGAEEERKANYTDMVMEDLVNQLSWELPNHMNWLPIICMFQFPACSVWFWRNVLLCFYLNTLTGTMWFELWFFLCGIICIGWLDYRTLNGQLITMHCNLVFIYIFVSWKWNCLVYEFRTTSKGHFIPSNFVEKQIFTVYFVLAATETSSC